MASNFPLLKLPLIAMEQIIDQLDFLDLVQISMKSTKLRGMLQLIKLPVRSLHLFVTKKFYGILITRNRNCFSIETSDCVPVDTITELAKIQGKPMEIWKRGKDELKVKSDRSILATLKTIVQYILSISKVAQYSLTYDDAKTEIRSLFIWQITTQLDEFNSFLIDGGLVQISSEDLKFLLEEISVTDLHMNVDCPGFKFQKSTKDTVFSSESPSWIDCDQFSLGPKTVTAHFSGQKVSVDVLNRLIKDWAEGKNPKLREVEFTWKDNDPESLAMAQKHETRPPKAILPNRNIEQLKGLCINYSISYQFWRHSVLFRVHLFVEKDLVLHEIDLEDQN